MRFVDRIKTSYDLWKLNKYTKRRTAPPIDWDEQIVQGVDNAVIDPMNFSNRSPEFYDYYYQDGVYYNLPGTQGHDMAGQSMSYVSPPGASQSHHLSVDTRQPRRRSLADLSTLYESEDSPRSTRSSNVSSLQIPSSPAVSNSSCSSPSSSQFTHYHDQQSPRRSNRRNPQHRNSEAYNFNY